MTEEIKVPGWRPTSIEIILFLILLMMIVAYFIWSVPAMKQVVHDSAQKDIKIADLKTEVETWKNKSLDIEEYYPSGKLKKKVKSNSSAGTKASSHFHTFSDEELKKHDMDLEKRGLASVGIGFGGDGHVLGKGSASVAGPFGITVEPDITDLLNLSLKGSKAFLDFNF